MIKRIVLAALLVGMALAARGLGGVALAALPSEPSKAVREGGEYDAARQEMVNMLRFPAHEDGLLDIETGNGAISVSSWDKPEVELVVTRRVNGRGGWLGWITGDRVSDATARAAIENVAVIPQSGEGVLRVRTQVDETFGGPEVQLHLALRVPRQTALHLFTANGRVSAEGTSGLAELQTVNGEVVVEGIAGDVRARTGNGAIRLSNINGAVNAESENGAIDCSHITGMTQLRTTNGAISARHADREALACRTVNGAIDVRYPKGAAHSLDLSAGQGSVDCYANLDAAQERSPQRLRGTIHGGGSMICLNTSNGSIAVSEE